MKRCTLCKATFDGGLYCPTCATFVPDEGGPVPRVRPTGPQQPPPIRVPGPAAGADEVPPAPGQTSPWSRPDAPPPGAPPRGASGFGGAPVPGVGPFGPGGTRAGHEVPTGGPTTGPYGTISPPGGPPLPAAAGALGCRQCGGGPTVAAEFHQGIGMVFARRTITVTGPFCRSCGQHYGRALQAKTLLTGWWGMISFFFNLFFILGNAGALSKVGRLPAPEGGNPEARRAPGAPLLLRPAFYAFVAGVIVIGAFLAWPRPTTSTTVSRSPVGQCLATGSVAGLVPCTSPHEGKVTSAAAKEDACPPATELAFDWSHDPADPGRYLCIDLDR